MVHESDIIMNLYFITLIKVLSCVDCYYKDVNECVLFQFFGFLP